MSDVAWVLSRPPTYTTKFVGCELGAQITSNDHCIVNGAHNADRLRELLDVFIYKFVLCKSYKNPETELVIIHQGPSEDIIRNRKACGKGGKGAGVDMRNTLTTFIVKNPSVEIKKGKSKKKTGDDAASDGGGGGNLEPTAESPAAELNKDVAIADTSPEAVKRRIKALEGTMAAAVIGGDDDGRDEDSNSPYAILGRWIEEDHKAISVAIFQKAQEFGIEKKHKAVTIIVQTLFSENIVAEIPQYAPLSTKLVTSNKHHKSLLGGIERFVGFSHSDLVSAVPTILVLLLARSTSTRIPARKPESHYRRYIYSILRFNWQLTHVPVTVA
ncbi:hypothetical protein CVT24_008301 [Panaeolus cyanescens]|uniref:W2 domain-containing protein n=1 Tax=Panaeolus cyanescens TaxID=181874 RepID=A0A409WZK7_9AGAR|nr:hypothetical protein CVT24_008301 [Panaeolus cyanescens]